MWTAEGKEPAWVKGPKVKEIMCLQCRAVIRFLACLFVLCFLMHLFFHSQAISTLCSAVVTGHCSGQGHDHRGQGHVRHSVTPLSALMHSGHSYMFFQVCRRLLCQHIVIKSNLLLKDDLDTWPKRKKVSVYNMIVNKSASSLLLVTF